MTAAQGAAGGATTGTARSSGANKSDGGHFWTILLVWLVLAAVLDPLFYFLAGPHMPPGAMTTTAHDAQFDFNILCVAAIPIILAVWVYFGYALIVWHHRQGEPLTDGPPIRGHYRIQAAWISVTTVLVLAAFVFGTVELIAPGGAGGGEGPAPIWTPAAKNVLEIQVIAQQWQFTYRYPSFGGFEIDQLVVPNDTAIAFHVTSLDVIHDFWAYQLGVKADANPGSDNVAFATTRAATGGFIVRCAELCGLWHGAMYTRRQGAHQGRLRAVGDDDRGQASGRNGTPAEVRLDLHPRRERGRRRLLPRHQGPLQLRRDLRELSCRRHDRRGGAAIDDRR